MQILLVENLDPGIIHGSMILARNFTSGWYLKPHKDNPAKVKQTLFNGGVQIILI